MNSGRIIKYEGNEKFLFILLKEEDKYFLFISKPKDFIIEAERNSQDIQFTRNLKFNVIGDIKAYLKINFRKMKVFKLNSEKEYEIITSVVKELYE